MKTKLQSVQIKSINANTIYEAMHRNMATKYEWNTMNYSLELHQLRKVGLEELIKKQVKDENGKVSGYEYVNADSRTLQKADKTFTHDIVNVVFSRTVKNYDDTVKSIKESVKKRITRLEGEYAGKLDSKEFEEELANINVDATLEMIEEKRKELPAEWSKSYSLAQLRSMLYEQGFTLDGIEYVVYKRSSAKSRVGNVTFIKKELAKSMMEWSHMGLDFGTIGEIDVAALSAYESLTGSTIEGVVEINPKHILLVDDVESIFTTKANVVKDVVDEEGNTILASVFDQNGKVVNSLFDGQSLGDASLFTGKYKGKGMMLLRQHFFKSAVFNANVIQFLKDHYGEKYETAKVKDALGNRVWVRDIKVITTPSSLKVFKFSGVAGGDKAMYKHWKKVVKADKSMFGICKAEKRSKRGTNGNMPLQQMSYQMLNSLPATKEQILELSKFELDYINVLKTDTLAFISHLQATATNTNSNDMFVALYENNNAIANTQLFKDFRKSAIDKHIYNIKNGKLRIEGDYLVMVGNPYEMLLHAVGKLNLNKPTQYSLNGSQVFTTLFNDGEELTGFRNPHTSANNVLKVTNTHSELISRYINLTHNIVAVNVIGFPILDILSGADFDSDVVLLSNDKALNTITKDIESLICINGVDAKTTKRPLNNSSRAIVDDAIASDVIGKIVNVAQLAQSIYYDSNDVNVQSIMKEVIEIVTVASGIAIDLAKRQYNIDLDVELTRLTNLVNKYKKKGAYPNFTQYTADKSRTIHYNTVMDYVVEMFKVNGSGLIERATVLKNDEMVDMWDLVMKCDENGEVFSIVDSNDNQENAIVDMINHTSNRIKSYYSYYTDGNISNAKKQQLKAMIKDERESLQNKLEKRNIKPVTLYGLLYHMFYNGKIADNHIALMNALYNSNPKRFITLFISQ